MSRPISYSDRLKIVSCCKKGLSFTEIGRQIGCSARSVKRIWDRYEESGYEGLKTKYSNSGRPSPYEWVKPLVEAQKTGRQGAPYIRSVLLSLHPDKKIPHERSIQRWWEEEREKKLRQKSIQGKEK